MLTDEQGDVRPVSNYVDMKFNRDNHERKLSSTLPRSHGSRYQQQQQQIPRNRVKFEPRKVCPSMMANGYEKTVKEVPKKKKEMSRPPPPPAMDFSSESEFESVINCQFYTDESENETIYDDYVDNDYTKRTFNEMETKMNAMTNKYFHKIKTQLSDTCSKLKIQQKLTKEKPKAQTKLDEKAAGDTRAQTNYDQPENDNVIKSFRKMKAECYSKIDENLKILQQIDSVNDKLYKNYMFPQN